MDRREFIKHVFSGERSNRLPRALYGAGRWAYLQTGQRPEDMVSDPVSFGKTLTDLFSGLDTDIIFPGSGLNSFPAEAIGGSLDFKEGQAPMLAFPIIQNTEDARHLSSIDITHSPHTSALVEMIRAMRNSLSDRFFFATSWGPFTWAMILCNWNLLQEKTASDRAFVKEICELGVRLSQAFLGKLIDDKLIDGIAIPDGGATLIPLDLYREVVLPCQKSLFDWAKHKGVWRLLHQCGNITPQIEFYPETGVDCISVDASVNVGEVYRKYQGQLVTAGNVDVVNTVFGGDSVMLCNAVRECVAAIPDPFHRYILMPSCDLPPETPMRNVQEFLSCADELRV